MTLPRFWRADAAAYLGESNGIKLQLNVENVFGRKYYATSHGNNNIMPARLAPFAFRELRLSADDREGQLVFRATPVTADARPEADVNRAYMRPRIAP